MNRSFYEKGKFDINENTPIICPECNNGKLISREKNINIIDYINYNQKVKREADFESDWLKQAFIGFLECDKCKEKICVAGKLDIYLWGGTDQGGEYIDVEFKTCNPEYFERPPRIFPIHEKIPKEIVDCLDSSFSLFWIDKESCANKVRICVELLMDYYGIAKYPKAGKRIPIVLQSRINDFGFKHKSLAEKLTAIKWIGNFASHSGNINSSDIMDAYQILKYVFDKLFSDDEKEIEKITATINKNKKPRSLKKKK
jgi:hypothetical protein